jgi:hypothetical protein
MAPATQPVVRVRVHKADEIPGSQKRLKSDSVDFGSSVRGNDNLQIVRLLEATGLACRCDVMVVHLDEQTLRTQLSARGGRESGHEILDKIQKGEVLTITLSDGKVRTFEDVSDALNQLRSFGWTADPPPLDGAGEST